MLLFWFILAVHSAELPITEGWFALTHGAHELTLTDTHFDLIQSGALEVRVVNIGTQSQDPTLFSIQSRVDFQEMMSANVNSAFKIYEFPSGDKTEIELMLHGSAESFSPHVIMLERNGIITGSSYNLKMRSKQRYQKDQPMSWINTRWGQKQHQLIAEGSTCRFAQGSGHVGYQPGSFSWGIDILDTRDSVQDLIFCPAESFAGTNVNVYVLDTGIGSHNSMNSSNVACEFDYFYDPSTYGSRPPCDDLEGHGSHVAGLVASNIYGVAPMAKLKIYKVLSDQGYGSFSGLAAALAEIYSKNVNKGVITMSLGVYGDTSNTVSTLLTNLMQDRDMIVLAAAGNDAKDACSNFPSNVPGVISVAAVDVNMRRPEFSNYGSCVTIFAPGRDIISCGKTGTSSVILSGTSMATPIAAGIMAMYRQKYPTSTRTSIITNFLNYATYNTVSNRGANSPNRLVFAGDFSTNNSPIPPRENSEISYFGKITTILLMLLILYTH